MKKQATPRNMKHLPFPLSATTISALVLFGCGVDALSVGEQTSEQGEVPVGMDGTGATPTIVGETREYPGGCGGTTEQTEYARTWGVGDDWGDLVGTDWEGHIDLGPTMRLSFGVDGSTTVRFGEEDLFPPPTDPNVGWACDPSLPGGVGCSAGPVPGVLFEASRAVVSPTRVSFALQGEQPWDDWCALQEPKWVPQRDGCHFDVEDRSQTTDYQRCAYLGPNGDEYEQLDCGWLRLAGSVCSCNVDACSASIHEEGEYVFDFSRSDDGTELEGSADIGRDTVYRVKLRRVE